MPIKQVIVKQKESNVNMFPIYNIYDLAESLVNLSDGEKESLQLHLNTQYGLCISVARMVNEAELDKLANKSMEESGWGDCDNSLASYVDGFKAGYIKAKLG